MSTPKQRVVVVCPGRGSYNAPEWGYLKRHHADKGALLESFDDYRPQHQQPTLTELDQDKAYSLKLHSRGDHASGLIYACLLYTSPSPRDGLLSRMPSSA